MMLKLLAAALCGIVIATIASHANAAGPGSYARGFAGLERTAAERASALAAVDDYLKGFDQTRAAR